MFALRARGWFKIEALDHTSRGQITTAPGSEVDGGPPLSTGEGFERREALFHRVKIVAEQRGVA